jgi:hypothetical protein
MSKGRPRDHRKEQFWRRLLAKWRKSDLSVRSFCLVHGVCERRFHRWRHVLQQRDGQDVRFVPVNIVPDEKTVSAADGSAALELVLKDGRLLRIGTGFDAATLTRLLALLEEGRPC